MSNKEPQCGLCKHFKVKNKFFGGTKYLCTTHRRGVAKEDMCSEYTLDTDKLLQQAGFRSHTYGNPDACYSCVHCKSAPGKEGTDYSCKKLGIQFWPKFPCMDYICSYFQDGGMNALVDRLADLIVEQENSKKGGT